MTPREKRLQDLYDQMRQLFNQANQDVARLTWLETRLSECDAAVSESIFGTSNWTDIREAIDTAKGAH